MARFRIRKVPSKRLWRVYEDSRIISVHRSRSAAEDKLVRLERSRPKRRQKRSDFDSEKLVKLLDKQVDKLTNNLLRPIKNAKLNEFDIEEGRKLYYPENNIPVVIGILHKKAKVEKDLLTKAAMYLVLNSLSSLSNSDAPVPGIKNMGREYQVLIEDIVEEAKKQVETFVRKIRGSRKVDTSQMTWKEMKDLANVSENKIRESGEDFNRAVMYAIAEYWISDLVKDRETHGVLPTGRERDQEIRKLTRSVNSTIQEYLAFLRNEGILKI